MVYVHAMNTESTFAVELCICNALHAHCACTLHCSPTWFTYCVNTRVSRVAAVIGGVLFSSILYGHRVCNSGVLYLVVTQTMFVQWTACAHVLQVGCITGSLRSPAVFVEKLRLTAIFLHIHAAVMQPCAENMWFENCSEPQFLAPKFQTSSVAVPKNCNLWQFAGTQMRHADQWERV